MCNSLKIEAARLTKKIDKVEGSRKALLCRRRSLRVQERSERRAVRLKWRQNAKGRMERTEEETLKKGSRRGGRASAFEDARHRFTEEPLNRRKLEEATKLSVFPGVPLSLWLDVVRMRDLSE